MTAGMIFDIKRFSIHDGPGIRTTVFLKGCPLTCGWCHNPESQRSIPELILRPGRCIACGACMDICQRNAITEKTGSYQTDRAACIACGECVEVCYAGAREILGRELHAKDVIEEVLRDQPFFDQSGGGVTFSGGEPLMQPEFLKELLKTSKDNGLHTALDTCGYASREDIDAILDLTDLILFDVKILDDKNHVRYTGASNTLVKKNLSYLSETGQNLIIRYPVLPGVNDSREQIRKLGEYLKNLPTVKRIDLLPYHELSGDKYLRLGLCFDSENWRIPSKEELGEIQYILMDFDLLVSIGG
jgi:pyruvate formate lyase activating enzyme